jgi:NAD(P)H-hydrate repair Nnr-like enzyme with NAD(P)H-hydrate dehydratase domain/NAD(P)H-hydrate repair Nnr-like enzyme with NAD(P)H-hydrate epimerase domain
VLGEQAPAAGCTRAAQSRAVDRCAIDEHGLPGPVLMARAARAAFRSCCCAKCRSPECLQMLCGPGNNGGDGLLLAMLGAGRGIPVRVFLVDGEPRSDDARRRGAGPGAGLELEPFAGALDPAACRRRHARHGDPRCAARRLCAAMRGERARRPVLALDVPSGWTATRAAPPARLSRATGPSVSSPPSAACTPAPGRSSPASVSWTTWMCRMRPLRRPGRLGAAGPERELPTSAARAAPHAHKGASAAACWSVATEGMGGAIHARREAALRCGSAWPAWPRAGEHSPPLLARRPECMASAVEHRNDLEPLLPWADAIVIGPGLGQGPGASSCCTLPRRRQTAVCRCRCPEPARRAPGLALPPGSVVITPHPGEAARLLGRAAEVQADRFAARASFGSRPARVVLKGPGSLVRRTGRAGAVRRGNPGMASGGMGDVLSGVIGACWRRAWTPRRAARWARYCTRSPAIARRALRAARTAGHRTSFRACGSCCRETAARRLCLQVDEDGMVALGVPRCGLTPGMSLHLTANSVPARPRWPGELPAAWDTGAVKSPTYTLVEPYLDLAAAVPLRSLPPRRSGRARVHGYPRLLRQRALRSWSGPSAVALFCLPRTLRLLLRSTVHGAACSVSLAALRALGLARLDTAAAAPSTGSAGTPEC